MDDKTGGTASIWMTVEVPTYAPLRADTHADVCIVGAGIAGLTTAYLLAREGKSVVVLDDGPIGSGMTARTTAHLSCAIDDRYYEIERLHGQKGAHLAADSHCSAIDRIEAIAKEEGIECDFERVDGYLFTPPGEPKEELDRELKAAHRAGLTDVEKVERAPIEFYTGMALRFPRQGQFHPTKYVAGLARAVERRGGRIFTGSHAASITGGSRARVETSDGRLVTADAIVVATNTPVTNLVSMHTKQAPYTTYVIAATVPAGAVHKALYWDTPDPYHYVRLQTMRSADGSAKDLLIVGGEDHKTGQAENYQERHQRLEAWARERFPIGDVEFRWSGQVMEPVDGIAFLGRNPGLDKNMYIVTGDSGMGMTHGTIGGMLITDQIMGRESPWEPLYDPSRKSLRVSGILEFVGENVNVAGQYLSEYVTGGDVGSPDEIAPGEGAVIGLGVTKMAVYKDEQGNLYKRSALCAHLGCVVKWNSLEKSWDCPCHGSRYDRFGEVITGPANRGLAPVKE
ncbi:FAD-dependent oxidoreductase [Geomonas sp. RF6]|uniref:FAD-dependent oxidoreductase n=1 Tax=Geomonas sp. RF6 TaxID=2897342 RepID=UPI001E29DFB8|nr:FAD-dependent oxidoreductase [Geomonas sp. RF6]UFS69300.1 FAD-dependent oxidoreductase [Geomonas sp. RF6]